jgi:hypothetical protein
LRFLAANLAAKASFCLVMSLEMALLTSSCLSIYSSIFFSLSPDFSYYCLSSCILSCILGIRLTLSYSVKSFSWTVSSTKG